MSDSLLVSSQAYPVLVPVLLVLLVGGARFGFGLLVSGCWLLVTGCLLHGACCLVLGAGCWFLGAGCWSLVSGFRLLVTGFRPAPCFLRGCWVLVACCCLPAEACFLA